MNEFTDPKWVTIWMKVGEFLVIGIFAFYSWINTRSKATQAAVDELAKQHRGDIRMLEDARRAGRAEIEKRINASNQTLTRHIEAMQADLVERVDTVETDVRRLSDRISGMPNKADIVRIHDRIDSISKSGSATASAMKEMSKTLQIMQVHLMREKQ